MRNYTLTGYSQDSADHRPLDIIHRRAEFHQAHAPWPGHMKTYKFYALASSKTEACSVYKAHKLSCWSVLVGRSLVSHTCTGIFSENLTAVGTGGREGGSPAPPEGRQPGRGSRQMRSYPSTAAGSPFRELILIRWTAACPRAALACFSFSSDLRHVRGAYQHLCTSP